MKSRSILGGAGLVLIGILIGAFVAALVGRQSDRLGAGEQNRVVESIRVGNPDYQYPSGVPQAVGLNTIFKDVARLVRPAVVSIHSGAPVSEEFQLAHPRMPQFRGSSGSGVIISDAGYIVTNYHVVADATELRVVLTDKREFDAKIIGMDPSTDLAVVKIDDAGELPVIALGDSDQAEVGDWVLAIGNPFHLTSTVTAGIISAMGRDLGIIREDFGIEDFIQTDAAINPGNSGGALATLDGQLIGINTAIATQDGVGEGYGFAVPVNLMTRVVGDLIAYGEVKRAFLGITMAPMTSARARESGLELINGVYVASVVDGGSAARHGVQRGDVILAIDGQPVDETNALQSRIAIKRPGEEVELEVWRNKVSYSIRVPLIDRDDASIRRWLTELSGPISPNEPMPEIMEARGWGISFRSMSAEELTPFGVSEGAYIGYIDDESTAGLNGLPRDVVITEIEGESVLSAEDALTFLDLAIAQEKISVLIRVERRDGIAAFYEVDVPELE